MKKEYGIVLMLTFIVAMIWAALRLENKLNENVYPDDNSTIIIVNEITDTIPIQDTIIIPINQDSIDRIELIKDSIAFRKITIKINGGLNGFTDRYAMWLRARNSINK